MREPAGDRIEWIDIAKAIAILLIVVYHTSLWFTAYVLPEAAVSSRSVAFWQTLSRALIPVRIPLFFLVSGILAQRAVRRPWRELTRTRFLSLLWPFAVWTVLIAVPWSYRVAYSDPLANVEMAGTALIFAGTHFWYLPALVVFIATAKLLANHPAIALGGSAAAVVIAAFGMTWLTNLLGPVLGVNVYRWLTFAIWFMIGCFLRSLVQKVASSSIIVAIAGVGAFTALRWVLLQFGSNVAVATALTIVGMISMVILCRLLSRSRAARRLGRFLAGRTLAIYVGHAFVLEVIAVAVEYLRRRGIAAPAGDAVINGLFVPVAVATVVSVSLGMYALCRRLGLGWLYSPPARFSTPSRGSKESRQSSARERA